MRWMWKRALLVSAIGLGAGGAVGCAEERPPINRVQPNALAKSFFVGEKLSDRSDDPEFWTQGTVVDVGYGAAQDGLFTSTYAQPLSRIKWVIQEDLLIGRITHERIDGSDGKGAGPATDDGVIAVAYPILGHFDIRRDYNPTTGEESNVIVENTSDRAWYEREYMRVDWSQNLNVDSYDFDTLSLLGIYGGVSYESLAYYINDPSHPDAPHFDPETGYFDVTNKAFATPAMIDLSHFGWGIDAFPACFLDNDFMGGSYPSGNCNPVELTIRQSFRRVVDEDFEPQDWDGYRFQAFGAFTIDRSGYARNYGMSDDKWHRFISRYNIWNRSHYYDDPATMTGAVECFTPTTTPAGASPNRDENNDGTEDECAVVTERTGVAGSRCDQYKQKCTLPFQVREARPVVWHYSKGSNNDYFDGTDWAAHEWDVALRSAVQTAKYAECARTSGNPGGCEVAYPHWKGQQDENEDAVALTTEVDACRHGLAYQGEDCDGLADRIGSQRGYDPGVIAVAKMKEMVVLCHGPVEANDPAECGDRRLPADVTAVMCEQEWETFRVTGTGDARILGECDRAMSVRMGDLRYHQVNVMKAPQTPSPWGIYTDAEDPLTGEKVAASINIWSHVNDLWSQGIVDQMRYIKGELSTEEVTEGTYVRNWVNADKIASGGNIEAGLPRAEVQKRMADFAKIDVEKAKEQIEARNPAELAALKKNIQKMNAELRGVKAELGAPSVNKAKYEQRRKAAVGSAMEAELFSPAMQQLAGTGDMPFSAAAPFASPLQGLNPSVQRDIKLMKEVALSNRGACILQEAPPPTSMTGLADIIERKFGAFDPNASEGDQLARGERIRKYLANRAQYAVIIHEMGHSIGMRHNFVSSSDAWGYRPQYWQLRTKDGSVTDSCDELVDDGASCVGPRYWDPMTEEERSNMLWMFMQSSVMDYAGEAAQDLIGLGAYDFAAARMFYGEVMPVHAAAESNLGTDRGWGHIGKADNFGGILGFDWTSGDNAFHYSQLQNEYQLIQNCAPVDAASFKPATWNTERDGEWDPTLDGGIVQVNGQYTRCKQQKVDYVPFRSMRKLTADENADAPGAIFYRGGPVVDHLGRTRVPYGFATDRWADLGNLAVYRHDNGADPYELFNFLIAQQETGHIFDAYRRNRQSFSVRSYAGRNLGRYNEKMRDAAKGLGLIYNIYQDIALEGILNNGAPANFDQLWPVIASFFQENILASGMGFDHFARQMARPHIGPHYELLGDATLRAGLDSYTGPQDPSDERTMVVIPNGATGYHRTVGIGGKPLNNTLAEDKGEYDSEYTIQAGAYYEKAYTTMLLTESVDNFISDSRTDFLDARYRSTSIADLFTDGYRRWLGNNLTGDDFIKGPRVAADASGRPLLDAASTDPDPFSKLYPEQPIGWTQWWSLNGPEVCFPNNGSTICSVYGQDNTPYNPNAPANARAIDPQIGWEQQKFLIAWTMMYLPENAQQNWLDMMRIWEVGADADPGFDGRIEFHSPYGGEVYVARTYGTEEIFGKTVQKGIAARMLEWANELLAKAYEVTEVTENGVTWYVPVLNADGQPIVKWDPTVWGCDPASGSCSAAGTPGCNADDNSACTCAGNLSCMSLKRYVEVPFFMRQALAAYRLADPSMKGIY